MTSSIQFLGGKPIELNRRQIVKGLAAGYIVAVSYTHLTLPTILRV